MLDAHPLPVLRPGRRGVVRYDYYAHGGYALPPMLHDPMSESPDLERTPARVLIADDHAPTRAGVRSALEAGGFDVIAEAPDGEQAVELALEHRPDVCLLDISMPGGGGIKAA